MSAAQSRSAGSIEQDRQQLLHGLAQYLPAHSFQLDWVAHIESTNSALLQAPVDFLTSPVSNISMPVPRTRILLADAQSAGRGQAGRAWQSTAGNLFLSVRTGLPAPLSGALALDVALVLLSALQLPPVPSVSWGIKWPNDLYAITPAGPVKWGGILIEPVHAREVVMGIGINLDTPLQSLGNRQIAGLNHWLTMPLDTLTVAQRILPPLLRTLAQWQPQCPDRVQRFARHDVLAGRSLCLYPSRGSDARPFCGQGNGIAADGALLLWHDGQQSRHYHGHVQWD